MRVLAVPRSMAMSLEMAPKSEEIMEGPGDWGLEGSFACPAVLYDPVTPKTRGVVTIYRKGFAFPLPCPPVEFKA
jgi:hypothetical protein